MAIPSPLWLQKVDLDPDIEYTGAADRQLLRAMLTEGVLTGGAVSQRGAGANFTVDVSIFAAVVDGDNSAGQGSYLVWSDAIENVAVSAAPGSNSRIDRVVLEVNDEQAGGSAGVPFGRVRVIAGTPAGSPVAPAEPSTAITLATIGPITSGTSSITNSLITDARPFARLRHQVAATANLVDGAVTTAKIADANVTTAKIADANVTTAKIADANVTTAKIADANVTEAKLAAATTGTLASGTVKYAKLGTLVAVWSTSAYNDAGFNMPAGFRPASTVGVRGTTWTFTITSAGVGPAAGELGGPANFSVVYSTN